MKRTDTLYAVTALFDTPDAIISAAGKTAEKGYTHFDVNTPYPVHGMDDAMKLKPSKLGFITLAFGLMGAGTALLFMAWVMTIAYPMIIGGKPFFAFPAFVPVTFEVTVLLATLATVIGMITFFFQFPRNAHPLHETGYMRQVSNDRFGVVIEATDPKFDEAEVKKFLEEIGGKDISNIYTLAEIEFRTFSPRFIMLLVGVVIIVSAGTYLSLNKVLFMVPYNWMMEQPRLDAQEYSIFFSDGFGMRQPVEGTVSRNSMPYIYEGMKNQQPEEPLVNPYFANRDIVELGKERYDIYCSPCHGFRGEGDSRLRGQFSVPPSLHSEKAMNWKDGDFYHIIMVGQNVMPSYASQLQEHERWAVINYIRVLQKAMNPTEEEIQKAKEEPVSK